MKSFGRARVTSEIAFSSVKEWRGGGRLLGGAAGGWGRLWQGQSGLVEPGMCKPSPQILHVQALVNSDSDR